MKKEAYEDWFWRYVACADEQDALAFDTWLAHHDQKIRDTLLKRVAQLLDKEHKALAELGSESNYLLGLDHAKQLIRMLDGKGNSIH